MRFIKTFLSILIVLVLILLIISFFLPDKVSVERSMVINAPTHEIFDKINTIQAWQEWSPWFEQDPNMEVEFYGPNSGVGSGYSWKSRKLGNGQITITESIPFRLVGLELNFEQHGISETGFILQSTRDGTLVIWSMDTELGWNPITRYFGLFMDLMLGSEFQKGLQNLARVVESN
jgi:hypothetical protein